MCLLVSFPCVPEALCQDAAGAKNMLATVEDVLADAGELELTAEAQGTKTYTAISDCEVTIKSFLTTYGPAELSVSLNDEKIITWQRQNDTDSSKLIVKGEEIAESNIEVKPGDFTAQPQETKIAVKKGDKLTLNLSGEFGAASAYLTLVAPGIPKSEASASSENSASSGTVVAGSGGGFLWKPISESRGGVVALILPPKYRHGDFDKKVWINGSANEVKEWSSGYHNGNRIHIFLKKNGASYGGKVTIELGSAKGGRIKWDVANGANRTEK